MTFVIFALYCNFLLNICDYHLWPKLRKILTMKWQWTQTLLFDNSFHCIAKKLNFMDKQVDMLNNTDEVSWKHAIWCNDQLAEKWLAWYMRTMRTYSWFAHLQIASERKLKCFKMSYEVDGGMFWIEFTSIPVSFFKLVSECLGAAKSTRKCWLTNFKF